MSSKIKKLSERTKIEKVLKKIEKDDFDEIDIDFLLIKLREFSEFDSTFREISHFAAHNETRDKGQTNSHLSGVFASILTFMEHRPEMNNPIDFHKDIPNYVIEKIYFNAKIHKDDFLELYKCSYTSFINKFKKSFIKIPNTNNYKMKTSPSKNIHSIIIDLLELINFKSILSQDQIINEICRVLDRNSFIYDKNLFISRSNRICLYIIYLMHATEYILSENKKAFTYINISKDNICLNANMTFRNNLTENESNITFSSTLVSTDLKPSDFCSDLILILINNNLEHLANKDLFINENGKLDIK